MRRRASWSVTIVGLACAGMILGAITPSYAARDIFVTIGGNSVPWTSRPNCDDRTKCFDIAGTYGSIVIEPITVGSGAAAYARVEVQVIETASDALRILNAKVRSTDTANPKTVSIIFEREDIPNPSNAAPSTIWYNINLGGTFGEVAGHSITGKGFFKGTSSGNNWDELNQQGPSMTHTVTCPPTGCTTVFSSSTLKRGEQESPSTPARWVKGDLSITLQTSSNNNAESYVKLNPGSRIITSTSPPDIEPTPSSELSVLCSTTYSTAKMFGCPSCVTEDGLVAANAKIPLFASTNWDNLQQDLAQGKGEYLASLAALLEIPSNQRSEFYSLAQDQYRTAAGTEAPEQAVASLQDSWIRQLKEVN